MATSAKGTWSAAAAQLGWLAALGVTPVVSLPHPVLDPARWAAIVEVARRELLTPAGLRSLARGLLEPLVAHLGEACVGSVSEVFDAEPPFTPRGCIAQARGVAELLRALLVTCPRE
jgi:glycogen debranching enzyme